MPRKSCAASTQVVPPTCACKGALRGGLHRRILTAAREIGDRRAHHARTVIEMADAEIALATEKPANLSGSVTVIDAQRLDWALPADGTGAALACDQPVVILLRHSIVILAPVLRAVGAALLLLSSRVFDPSTSPQRVDFVLVRGMIGAIVRARTLSKLCIFCISLLFPVLVREHVLLRAKLVPIGPIRKSGRRRTRPLHASTLEACPSERNRIRKLFGLPHRRRARRCHAVRVDSEDATGAAQLGAQPSTRADAGGSSGPRLEPGIIAQLWRMPEVWVTHVT
jgi:hypothetical protein